MPLCSHGDRQTPRPSDVESFTLLVCALLLSFAGCAAQPRGVETTLAQAGPNRPELERVLAHYRDSGDVQKLRAAEFLVENLGDHGYVIFALYDGKKNEIPFDALNYRDFAAGQAALDAIEKEHGPVDFSKKTLVKDVEVIKADYLIDNIDRAFVAWRERPWARTMSFETFCQYVLPYRGSEEPLNRTRAALLERYKDLPARLKDTADAREPAGLIQADMGEFVRFSELYYLHPTDQSYEEMCAHRLGRCEDITNAKLYALRANAIPAASDYTPWWANRDNNHAWEVVLDAAGRAHENLSNKAAKVYRKVFATQRSALAFQKGADEELPPALGGKNYIDVTDQYVPVSDVTMRLDAPAPRNSKHAYLCVFNGGEWRAIHWAAIKGGAAKFTAMGRGVVYLPAYYADKKLVPAAAPFILTKDGQVRLLAGRRDAAVRIEPGATAPTTPDADTRREKPQLPIIAGKSYELFVWNGDWESYGKRTAGDQPIEFENVPADRLYWVVEEGSRKLERIFTIEDGRPVWW